jgi:hypothetical protein
METIPIIRNQEIEGIYKMKKKKKALIIGIAEWIQRPCILWGISQESTERGLS